MLSISLSGKTVGASPNIDNDTSTSNRFMQSIKDIFKSIRAEQQRPNISAVIHSEESKVEQKVGEELERSECLTSSDIIEAKEKLDQSAENTKDQIIILQ